MRREGFLIHGKGPILSGEGSVFPRGLRRKLPAVREKGGEEGGGVVLPAFGLGRHLKGHSPRCQVVVRNPRLGNRKKIGIPIQEIPDLPGKCPNLAADAALDTVHLRLDLIQAAAKGGKAAAQSQRRHQSRAANPGAYGDFFLPAPPGVLDDLGRVKIFLYDGLHCRQLPVGQLPRRGGALHAFTGGFRGIFFGTVLRRFRLYSQQGADGDAKDPAHGDQVLQFRHGGVRLPLAHRLAADAQPLPQGFLREAGGLSGLLDAAAQGLLLPHGINSFALTIPESGKKRNHRRVSRMSTTGCGWEKKIIFPESPEKTNKKSLLDNNFLLFYGKGRAAGGS